MTLKRKAETDFHNNDNKRLQVQKDVNANSKHNVHSNSSDSDNITSRFHKNIFNQERLRNQKTRYSQSQPYLHGVINDLIQDDLLRSVRKEITEHLHFTPKETDIYKIHQSGDLVNLDGLDDSSLSKLPSLLSLRDALYSSEFRTYISEIAQSGPLSGSKTDMAINVYTPGCHLLCHDDVIGSRRLSYILYLTDPDRPWKSEWGGALRLYPTKKHITKDGTEVHIPSPEFTVVIPPAWNQLSFFTIQPGKSFHDVEEVYFGDKNEAQNDGERIRMAISGWFHIPQKGEQGYEHGLEERLAKNSSLSQLENKADQLDKPKLQWQDLPQKYHQTDKVKDQIAEEPIPWTEDELEYLARYINPNYLVPDTLEDLNEQFTEESVITLPDFLHPKFALKLQEYVLHFDKASLNKATIPTPEDAICGVSVPPHKHRYLFRESLFRTPNDDKNGNPLDSILDHLLPSNLFAQWLKFLTNLSLKSRTYMARRFRKGSDYTLATGYDKPQPQLEITLGLTPSSGWTADNNDDGIDADADENNHENGTPLEIKGKIGQEQEVEMEVAEEKSEDEEINVGGYEVIMAADDDDDDNDDDGHEEEEEQENDIQESSHSKNGQKRKADPAIYKTGTGDDNDGVLFSMPASWNTLNIVLRDQGLLKFVKYISKSAKGDRWDIVGLYEVDADD